MLTPRSGILELTKRESEVFRLIASGSSNAELSEALGIGEATVKAHVSSILEKLNLRNRVEVVIFAYERGFVVPSVLKEGLSSSSL